MIENTHSYSREVSERNTIQTEDFFNAFKIEITRFDTDHRVWKCLDLVLADQDHSHAFYFVQIVVEGFGCFNSGIDPVTVLDVLFNRPSARTTAHDHTADGNVNLGAGGFADLLPDQHGGRG